MVGCSAMLRCARARAGVGARGCVGGCVGACNACEMYVWITVRRRLAARKGRFADRLPKRLVLQNLQQGNMEARTGMRKWR